MGRKEEEKREQNFGELFISWAVKQILLNI
jgi:hypothetical protein